MELNLPHPCRKPENRLPNAKVHSAGLKTDQETGALATPENTDHANILLISLIRIHRIGQILHPHFSDAAPIDWPVLVCDRTCGGVSGVVVPSVNRL
jgi:hypothetical protein